MDFENFGMLSYIDLFGYPVPFNIAGKPRFTSPLGGLLSVSIVVLLVLTNLTPLQDFFNKNTLSYTQNTVYEIDPGVIMLNQQNFIMALSIDQSSPFNLRPYFNITIQQRIYTRSQDGTSQRQTIDINLMPCQLSQFQKVFDLTNYNFTEDFNKLGLTNWLCPDIGLFNLSGVYSSILFHKQLIGTVFEFLQVLVTPCQNNSNSSLAWKPVCAPQSEIDAYLLKNGEFKINIYSSNLIVNPSIPSKYIQQYFDDEMYFTFKPYELFRSANIFLRKYEFVNDESLLPIEDISYNNLYARQTSDYRDLTSLGSKSDTVFARFYFRRSPYTEQIHRSYQKIQELLAQLGGFLQVMLIVFGFLILNYNKFQLMMQLANDLFNFNFIDEDPFQQKQQDVELLKNVYKKTEEDHLEKPQPLPTSRIESNRRKREVPHIQCLESKRLDLGLKQDTPRQRLSSINLNTPESQMANNELEQAKQLLDKNQQEVKQMNVLNEKDYFSQKLNQFLQKKYVPLQLTCKSLINQIFCGRFFQNNKESILLQKSIKKMESQLNILNILQKIQEIDKLKEILLTTNQQIIFNFQPKQIISLKKKLVKISRKSVSKAYNIGEMKVNQGNRSRGYSDIKQESYMLSQRIYMAYQGIQQENLQPADINRKLISNLGPEVEQIYLFSQLLQYNDKNHKLLWRQNAAAL
ncbi:hypothetical protein pb186bvf_021172 [Paramecium bursaria]